MIKRLFLDIETSPNVGLFWKPGNKLHIGPDAIVKERGIICACWKWEGEKTVQSITWDPASQDDTRVVKRMAALIAEADEVVAHNGQSFDLAWIRGRCVQLGVPMSPRLVVQDTYRLSRSLFNLNSHTLDYLGGYLGLGHKAPSGFSLWKKIVMDKCQTSLGKMVLYCKRDVDLLQQVWDKLMPYTVSKTHVTGYIGQCPECGSHNLITRKRRFTAAGHKQVQMQCKDCGKYHTVSAKKYAKAVGKISK
jgi:hypothetical protein